MEQSQASGARRPRTGQRREDGSPKGRNLAKPGCGVRQPYPGRGSVQGGVYLPLIAYIFNGRLSIDDMGLTILECQVRSLS